jgi:hypothetical protein
MSISETLAQYDLSGSIIREHGFTGIMRDYRIVVEILPEGATPALYSFLFRNTMQVHHETDERGLRIGEVMIDDQGDWQSDGVGMEGGDEDRSTEWCYVENSRQAAEWSERCNVAMHEVVVVTGHHTMSIVFQDLAVEKIRSAVRERPPTPSLKKRG